MKKINKHIEIVRSGVPAWSSMGLQSATMIFDVLSRHYRRVGMSHISTPSDLRAVTYAQPDLVFLGMKNMPLPGRFAPNKLWLSEHFDACGINYTGSDMQAIALDFNKPAAKRLVQDAGLATAPFFMAARGEYQKASALPLPFPLFVKPPSEGGGRGIGDDSVVRDFADFVAKVEAIEQEYHTPALVEAYLPGREFSVAILETSQEILAMPIELITEANSSGDRILGGLVKSADNERVVPVYNPLIKDKITDLATAAFDALGGRDYGRIDIRLDEAGTPHFLEANLIPGLALHDFTSYFTHACQLNESIDYETMILAIVEQALTRNEEPLPVAAVPAWAT